MPGAADARHLTRIVVARVSELVDQTPTASPPWLGAEERVRYDSLSSERQRRQFLAGRALARRTHALVQGPGAAFPGLSAPEQGPPARLTAAGGDEGTPNLSLSHSGNWVACAMSLARIGVDVQVSTRPRDVLALAELVCTPAERRWLSESEGQAQQDAFHALWALKESGFKAGECASLDQMGFAPDPGAPTPSASAWTLLLDDAVLAIVLDAPCLLVVHGDMPIRARATPWQVVTPGRRGPAACHAGVITHAHVGMLPRGAPPG